MNSGLEKYNRLVEALESLPSIGKKSATRMAYHMCMHDQFSGMKIAHAIENAMGSVQKCQRCGAMSEDEVCAICLDEQRDNTQLCIVENAKDILIIEENALFKGKFFVLDGLDEENLISLVHIVNEGVKEVIFALTPSVANDAVIMYVEDKLMSFEVSFTRIAQGVPTGVSLENIDMLSLTKALEDRVKI